MTTATTKTRRTRKPKTTQDSYTTADVTQRAEQLQGAITYLAGQLTVWTHRGQLDNLDKYLDRLHWDPKLGNLRQYREFDSAVKAAALILRAPPAAHAPTLPAPGEFDRPLTEREVGVVVPAAEVYRGDETQEVPVAVVTVVAPEGKGAFYHLNAATGKLEAAPMDEKSEGHMAEILRLHAEQDGEGWSAPVDVPGPDEDAVPPASSTEDPPTGAPGPGTSNDHPALD